MDLAVYCVRFGVMLCFLITYMALKFCVLALHTAWDAQAWQLIQLFQFGLSLFKHLKPRFYIESMNLSKVTINGP